MKPILYAANAQSFNNLGIGILRETVECFVTEEINGVFECSFSYPIAGTLFKEIMVDRFIKVDASYESKGQLFKIVQISKPMKGIVNVFCHHVSYISSYLMIKSTNTISNLNSYNALLSWKNALVGDDHNKITINPDSERSTITKSATWTIVDFENARKVLGGAENSILSLFGGEFIFDNYDIKWVQRRGRANSGINIRYGVNLLDFKQEENIAETYTSIYPYAERNVKWVSRDKILVTLYTSSYPSYIIDSPYASNYEQRRILRVNFSDDIQETSVANVRAKLVELTNEYIEKNNIGIPNVSITLSYYDLSNALNYSDKVIGDTKLHLGDTVGIFFEKLNINTTSRIVKCVYDVINERMESVVIGENPPDISDIIMNIENRAVTKTLLQKILDLFFGH